MNGKSGKLVAPAVAFMLCAVALIGVGFAITLNSTSTAANNTVSTDGLVLNVTDASENSTTTASFSRMPRCTIRPLSPTVLHPLI